MLDNKKKSKIQNLDYYQIKFMFMSIHRYTYLINRYNNDSIIYINKIKTDYGQIDKFIRDYNDIKKI